jgi:hypothetical protein
MSEFLVETYASHEAPSGAARVEGVSLAADQLSEAGVDVRLVRAIFVPQDDISVYRFEPSSADVVRDAMTRALQFDRITEAVSTDQSNTFARKDKTDDARP